MTSLTRKFLWGAGAMTVAVTVLASLAAFFAFQHELREQKRAFLADYVAERAYKEGQAFADLAQIHASADVALRKRLAALDQATADHLFETQFPLRPDGTRRSVPGLFEGRWSERDGFVYGLGAFIPAGRDVGPEQRRLLVAAAQVVGRVGEAERNRYESTYFYTPDSRLIIFGPDRDDQLKFYRETAPASLRIGNTDMARMVTPAFNPARAMACTPLHAVLSARDQNRRTGTACATPVDIAGKHVGAFGSSIQVTDYLAKVIKRTLPGSSNLVVDADGRLIAYPGFTTPGVASADTVARIGRDMQLTGLVADIRAAGKASGVLKTDDGRKIVAYGRLEGPGWYLLVSVPSSAIAWSAAKSAAWILMVGVLAAALQAALVVSLARRTIVKPLRRLASASAYRQSRRGLDTLADVEKQNDEIGALARALRRERNKVEDLLESLECRVKKRTADLEKANLEKSRFLANMSHELRTPLNGVVAVSEILARSQKTKRNRELAELVVSSGKLLESVLTDILDFSKIEAGQLALETVDFDLEKTIERISSLHEIVAAQKGLKLTRRIDPAARGLYRGDPVRVSQIVSNLLSNAIKFTAEGEVELTAEADDGAVVIRVRDTGVGFGKDVKAKLFRRFQQADASVTRKYGGTGLGLAICASLADMMGGDISAESKPGQGSVFTLRLPLERAAAPANGEGAEEAALGDITLEGARVLLAEDHPTNQKVVRLILDSVGVNLTVVENGALAVEAVEQAAFDLILMDMQMPVMDGLSATSAIRAFERAEGRARTPLIMLTANAMDEHIRAGRDAGADRHVAKPLRPDALLREMLVLLAAARDARLVRDAA